MTARLVSITTCADSAQPHDRISRLEAREQATFRAVVEALAANSTIPSAKAVYTYSQSQHPIVRVLNDHWEARFRLSAGLRTRIRQLERQLRALLGSDALDSSRRRDALAALIGAAGATRRDLACLSEFEATIIAQYRGMGTRDRQMVRTLFERLAGTTDTSEGRKP